MPPFLWLRYFDLFLLAPDCSTHSVPPTCRGHQLGALEYPAYANSGDVASLAMLTALHDYSLPDHSNLQRMLLVGDLPRHKATQEVNLFPQWTWLFCQYRTLITEIS
ncbi:uncharacterized protein AKAW2_50628S [Aspergillus luchuensis]|uniref:Uncharacterized protein n=1 Tax=Aspergillus kawachii TaxID=1069201 RepID=A0A7R7WC80_ASPKA|nr:uncharacterized protein AKAW2_50628S [Aspergillus luchuensis]BCS00287.1 hypothetical protein AKAW2_50628S [Aspergillus luchuensis]